MEFQILHGNSILTVLLLLASSFFFRTMPMKFQWSYSSYSVSMYLGVISENKLELIPTVLKSSLSTKFQLSVLVLFLFYELSSSRLTSEHNPWKFFCVENSLDYSRACIFLFVLCSVLILVLDLRSWRLGKKDPENICHFNMCLLQIMYTKLGKLIGREE